MYHARKLQQLQIYSSLLQSTNNFTYSNCWFLQKFIALESSPCMLFANDARRQLYDIFVQFGDDNQDWVSVA